jgi:ATP-dependent DNA helicase PIF1
MVDGDLFDKLAKIGSAVRKKPSEPFGGIQVSQSMFSQAEHLV